MDDVRIYNRALSAAEIQTLAGAQTVANTATPVAVARVSETTVTPAKSVSSDGMVLHYRADDVVVDKTGAVSQWNDSNRKESDSHRNLQHL